MGLTVKAVYLLSHSLSDRLLNMWQFRSLREFDASEGTVTLLDCNVLSNRFSHN